MYKQTKEEIGAASNMCKNCGSCFTSTSDSEVDNNLQVEIPRSVCLAFLFTKQCNYDFFPLWNSANR